VIRKLVIVLICLLFPLAYGQAQEIEAELPVVVDARVSTTPERARLILDLSGPADFAVATIADPPQIAVDVRASAVSIKAGNVPAGEGIVGGFSVEIIEAGRVRTWLALDVPAKVQQAYVVEAIDDQPARLVVDLVPATETEFVAAAQRDLEAAAAKLVPSVPPEKPVETEADTAPVTGKARPLIVIDPGHGGIDSGAEATNGIKEKNIVLAFARILQKLLVETGKFDVALTREDDSFLRLEERVALARLNKADLFISIHADYFQQDDVRGASIYIRDERATDVMDKVLADNENRVDLIAGFAVPKMDDHVVNILVDLMRREMRRQSYRVAQSIVTQLQPSVQLRRFPVRKANFMVLQAPDVPSVLVELGFLSNAEDIANLTTGAWRDQVAEALANGITTYFEGFAQK